MTIPELFLQEFDEEMPSTRKILERVPEHSFSWKPHEKSMTLGRLASHVADLPARCATIITTEELVRPVGFTPWTASTTAELLDHFDAVRASPVSATISSPSCGPSKWGTESSLPFRGPWHCVASSWTTTSIIAPSSASSCASSMYRFPACMGPQPTTSADARPNAERCTLN